MGVTTIGYNNYKECHATTPQSAAKLWVLQISALLAAGLGITAGMAASDFIRTWIELKVLPAHNDVLKVKFIYCVVIIICAACILVGLDFFALKLTGPTN